MIEKLDIDEIIKGNFNPKDYNDTVNKINEIIEESNRQEESIKAIYDIILDK